jgi:uncharacterized repeat protein (TIGR01451 family)
MLHAVRPRCPDPIRTHRRVSALRVEPLEDRITPATVTLDIAYNPPAPTTYVPGTQYHYVHTLTNSGTTTANGASVFEVVTGSASFSLSFTGGASGTFNNLTIPPGATVTLDALVTTSSSATGPITDSAGVTPASGDTNTSTQTSVNQTTTATPQADLAAATADSPDPVTPGTNLTYTVTVTTAGPSDAHSVLLSDPLPAGTTLVSVAVPAGWTRTDAVPLGGTGTITATIPTLAAGTAVQTFTVVVHVGAGVADGTVLTNTATVSAATTDPNPGNEGGTATTTVSTPADLGMTIVDGPDPVTAGTNLTYTATVTTTGIFDAQSVLVSDPLPAETTLVSVTLPAGWTRTDAVPAGGTGTITATRPTLAAGSAGQVFTVVVHVGAGVPDGILLTNTATVSAATTDPDPVNNSEGTTTTVSTSADLQVTTAGAPDPVTPGTDLTYTVTVNTAGPSDAQSVLVSDPLPAGTTLVSVTLPAGWTRTDAVPAGGTGTITATIPTLAAGSAGQVFTVVVHVGVGIAGTVLTNTATAAAATGDPIPGNNSDTATTTVGKADQTIDFTLTGPVTYGVAPITLTATATSGLPMSFTLVSGPGSLSGGVLTVTGAGSIVLRADQPGDANFNPAPAVQQTLLVTPAPLTATADDASRVVGRPNPAFTSTFTGFVDGDTPADLGGTLTFATPAVPGSPPGAYPITPSGLTSSDYAITFAAGTLTVTPAPPPLVVSGPADGSAAVFAPGATGQYPTTPVATLSPFGGIAANVRSATGDVNGDGFADLILVTGPGVAPVKFAVVSVADDKTVLVPPTDPFGNATFSGGGFVAAGDFDHDGRAEWVITPDQGGGPNVVVYSLVGTTATVRTTFLGIDDPTFRGGARAAVGDVNHDGTPDLAVAAGFLGGPRVALFDGTTVFATPTRLVGDFFAFGGTDATTLRNGVFVALGDVDGDGFADVIAGGGPGGGPRVLTISGKVLMNSGVGAAQAAPLMNFFVTGNGSDLGGVRVAAKDADGDARADVVAGSGEGLPSRVRVYLGKDITSPTEPAAFQDQDPFGAVLPGGVFVG